jgi:hypothetical protein
LSNDPEPEIIPVKLVEELSPPVVRMPEPNVILPAPVIDPTVQLNPLRSNPPEATFTAELAGIA